MKINCRHRAKPIRGFKLATLMVQRRRERGIVHLSGGKIFCKCLGASKIVMKYIYIIIVGWKIVVGNVKTLLSPRRERVSAYLPLS